MVFWWFMFIFNLMIPAMFILIGRLMWKNPPKKINNLMGYRTRRSMQNKDTWDFAHKYFGKLWWKIGWIILLPTVLIQIPFIHSSETTVGNVGGIICTVHCAILVASIIPTEKALKETFTDDGRRK